MGRAWKLPPQFPEVDKAIKEVGTSADFAEYAGINRQSYYKFQQGRSWPSYWTICAILDYTGKTFEELFRPKK